jgi:hypothetical protein
MPSKKYFWGGGRKFSAPLARPQPARVRLGGPRRLASRVDRILRGAKPGDLPVEYPTKFDLVLNLRVAEAIGITFPPSLIAADGSSSQGLGARRRGRWNFCDSVTDNLRVISPKNFREACASAFLGSARRYMLPEAAWEDAMFIRALCISSVGLGLWVSVALANSRPRPIVRE